MTTVLLSIGQITCGRAQLVRVEPVSVPSGDNVLQRAHSLMATRLGLDETVLDGEIVLTE